MKSKIKKVRNDLRALKKSSHAVQRLIEIQGLHFKRIDALEKMQKSQEVQRLIESERDIIARLELPEHIKENEELHIKYMDAIDLLEPRDKAMMLDCFINGMPYWKLAVEYGFAEEGARKHIESIVKKIAQKT